MHILKSVTLMIATLVLSHVALAAQHAPKQMVMTPESLQWMPVKDMPEGAQVAILSGNPAKREPFIVRIKLPADYAVPAHSHPVNEYDTVITGTYYLGMGNSEDKDTAKALPAGSFVMLPAKTRHYGYAKEETILQVSGIGPWGMIYKKNQDEG